MSSLGFSGVGQEFTSNYDKVAQLSQTLVCSPFCPCRTDRYTSPLTADELMAINRYPTDDDKKKPEGEVEESDYVPFTVEMGSNLWA